MFSLLCGAFSHFVKKREFNLLIIGLDNSGKTTLLEQVKHIYLQQGLEPNEIIPTVGLNIARLPSIKGVDVTLWDLGGQESLRSIWQTYFMDSNAIIFVIDTSDQARLHESRECLYNVLKNNDMNDAPLLLVANKQDVNGALSLAQISDFLRDIVLQNERRKIQAMAAINGNGVREGIEWIIEEVKKYYV